MDKITHLDSIEDIRENDIWANASNRYRITEIDDGECELIIIRATDVSEILHGYGLDIIVNSTNDGTGWWIERDDPNSYRRAECKSGCGSFVLTPGEEFDDQCPSCREADRLGAELGAELNSQ